MRPFFRARRALLRGVGVALAATGWLPGAPSGAGQASEPAVLLGEVLGKTAAGEFSGPLRSALHDEIRAAELGSARDHFVLSATLLRLDAERVGRGARATAQVSLVLRRARQQSLHAILTGHATAEETDGSVNETRQDALKAAVRSALKRLPEAVR